MLFNLIFSIVIFTGASEPLRAPKDPFAGAVRMVRFLSPAPGPRPLVNPGDVCLSISVTNFVNMPTFAWQDIPSTQGSGSGSIMAAAAYTGPAYVITCTGLTNNCYIQTSTDLINWTNFVPLGAILTVTPGNPVAIILPQPEDLLPPSPMRFFRTITAPP
jgi:hypothetical protein